MNKWIVVTTINQPTKAIKKISQLAERGWRCVVVGDLKTPANWSFQNIDYLSYEDQLKRYGDLATAIPANHYSRKNLGYLYAIEQGAEIILETDDDNIPGGHFGEDMAIEVSGQILDGDGWVNIYKHFTDELIWPRGNPLDTIHQAGVLSSATTTKTAPIQQFLADGDPDVDAIYRLVFKEPVYFKQREPILLEKRTWCSFNSQNTIFFKEAFPALFLPCRVSFRMTDIWRSLVAQASLWANNRHLAFRSATVIQERNEHNLMHDFRDEVDGYLNNKMIAEELEKIKSSNIEDFVISAWEKLNTVGVSGADEIRLASMWMEQVQKYR